MIQRIQTIFLLLASGATFGLLALPFATTEQAYAQSTLFADQQYNLFDHWSLLALFLASGTIWLLAVFLFQNRKLQMRVTLIGISLLIGGIGVAGYFFGADSAEQNAQFAVGIALPLVSIFFASLARGYINKDERLVRSADRLR